MLACLRYSQHTGVILILKGKKLPCDNVWCVYEERNSQGHFLKKTMAIWQEKVPYVAAILKGHRNQEWVLK